MTKPTLADKAMKRQRVAQATFDRVDGKLLKYGETDCMTILRLTVVGMGHPNPLRGVRKYLGEAGALRALRQALADAGLPPEAGLADLMDARGFERIAAASVLPGDIVGLPADGPFQVAIGMALGNGKVEAFAPGLDGREIAQTGDLASVATLRHPETGESVVIPAWRIEPCLP